MVDGDQGSGDHGQEADKAGFMACAPIVFHLDIGNVHSWENIGFEDPVAMEKEIEEEQPAIVFAPQHQGHLQDTVDELLQLNGNDGAGDVELGVVVESQPVNTQAGGGIPGGVLASPGASAAALQPGIVLASSGASTAPLQPDPLPWTAVTFGLGLVDLGRRGVEFDPYNIPAVLESILQAWNDHAAYGNLVLFNVYPQPIGAIGPKAIAIIVETDMPDAYLALQYTDGVADDVRRWHFFLMVLVGKKNCMGLCVDWREQKARTVPDSAIWALLAE